MPGSPRALPRTMIDRILGRLGLVSDPPTDLSGLRLLYRAWCLHVPFDNVRKMIALRAAPGPPLPGGDAREFFEAWIGHGCGATCWPGSNALYRLARSIGFAARRVGGSMRDLGELNHGTVKVRLEGEDWLVDSSMLTDIPLHLGTAALVHRDGIHSAEVEPVDSTHVVWFDAPPNPEPFPCRLLLDPASSEEYNTRYEASRERSPFNQRLFARRNRRDEVVVLVGNLRHAKSAAGLSTRELSREEVARALVEDIGISEELVEAWVRAGGLDASFEPPAGPKPPPITRVPPSRR